MTDYKKLVKALRDAEQYTTNDGGYPAGIVYRLSQAADVIEQLSNAGSAYGRGWTLGYVAGREESKPRWIPATEFPPEGETYGDTTFSVEVLGTEGFTYRKAYYNFKYNLWIDGNEEQEWPSITYWMYLPEPPKEETE